MISVCIDMYGRFNNSANFPGGGALINKQGRASFLAAYIIQYKRTFDYVCGRGLRGSERGCGRQECISRRAVRRCARCSTANTGGRVQWSARVECLPARGAQVGRSRVAYWTAHLCRIHFR